MTAIPQPEKETERDYSLNPAEIIHLITKYQLLPRLIGELIIDRAILSISITKEEINQTYQQFCRQQRITNDKELQLWLKDRHLILEQLKDLLVRKLKIAKFKQAQWDSQVDSYFHQHKSQLDRVVYSLIQVRDDNLALELYIRLREKETSFADIARQYSEGMRAETGGLIGPVDLGTCPAVWAELFAIAQTGHIYPPQKLGNSVVIVRLEQYIAAQLNNRMRQRLLNELFAAWLQKEIAVIQHKDFS
ncbi:MAG: peptidylprolyl isomerase [Cyanobacteria bacterium P01_A01_bin.40]